MTSDRPPAPPAPSLTSFASTGHRWRGVIHQYADRLPVSDRTPVVTLNEGNTPLIQLRNFSEAIGAKFDIWLKYEAANPTASFKDRGMTLAVSKACERQAKILVCASTGNTSASAAAYAARAGLKCVVLLPHGKIALGKLAQALVSGAVVISIDGNFDAALRIVTELGATGLVEVVNSINPVRIEGQKTAAFEICDQLGRAPDYHFLPVGNAGNITAYWRGFKEYYGAGLSNLLPKMRGFQAAGAAPIVDGHPIDFPETVASAIRIGNPASWRPAVLAATESGGAIGKVSDERILEAYQLIARTEGLFVEPASAAPLAGLIELNQAGQIPPGCLVTVTMTGHGLKDPDTAVRSVGAPPAVVPAEKSAVMKAMGL